ncbi:MAG: LCP family protein [Candidatus Peribacteria bacterium]|nr:MAG: LCP family protein [Candidatus Peribacteria bacterium]
MIAGYAGEQARGGYLTDTIMLASFNPSLNATTFLSVPRDLYVTIKTGYDSKINGLYRNKYLSNDNDTDAAALALADKVTEITGVPIQYYVLVNFDGFVELIDGL